MATVGPLLDFIKSSNKSLRSFWRYILNRKDIKTPEYDSDALIPNESNIYSNGKLAHSFVDLNDSERHNDADAHETERWGNTSHPPRQYSTHVLSRVLRLVGPLAFGFTERFLIFAGYAQILIGIATYTGKGSAFMCHECPLIFL